MIGIGRAVVREEMGRRRNREWDIAMGVAQLAALLVAGAVIFPPFRQMLLGAVVLAGVVAFGIFLIRHTERKPRLFATNYTTLDMGPSLDQATVPRLAASSATVTTEPEGSPPAGELLEQLRSIDWFQFEKLVALGFRRLGYSVTRLGGANPDGGVDLVIEKDNQRAAVQCKQWKTWKVGVKPMREFIGALTDSGISKGIFITLNGYTGPAKQLAEKHGIEIVNEGELVNLIEESGARFDPETLAILSDTRKFCPKCEREMVLRTATKGAGAGRQFWGCSAYPECRFTLRA